MCLHMQGTELVQDRVILVKIWLQILKLRMVNNSKIIQGKIVKTALKIDKILIINSKTIISSLLKIKTSKFLLLLVVKDQLSMGQEQISTKL